MAINTLISTRGVKRVALAAGAATVALTLAARPASAQTNYIFQPDASAPEADRQWHEPTNWLDPNLGNMFVPNVAFNERAIIDNGATAVLTVSEPNMGDNSVVTPGAVAIQDGGLDIRSTGALFVTEANGAPGNLTVGGSGTGVLTVNPGATLEVEGSFTVTTNTANTVTLGGASGGATMVTADSAVLGGTTHVFPNATFTINGGLTFTNTSVYQANVSGAGVGLTSVGGSVALGGALEMSFSTTPSVGDSWTLIEGNTIGGGFSSVSNNADLAFNQTVVVSNEPAAGGGRALRASVEEVLVLEVNRNTGTATITHPGASTITLDGYFIGSDAGLLSDSPAAWTSLTESGQLGNDWIETAQTTTNIGELKIGGDATFGGDVALGAVFDPLAGEFGAGAEDLQFRYRRSSDGVEFPGIVRYTGDVVNSLVLQVDPAGSGDAYLRNTSGTTVQIDAYEVLSDGGSLDATGWDSLDDQDATSNEWLEAIDNNANLIAEFDSQGFTTIAPGDSLNLGPLFTGGTQDLEFNFLMQGQEDGTPGVVIYEQFVDTPGIAGDFNDDGVVDAVDYAVWRDNLGADGLPNDNDLGTVGQAHYDLWRSQYGTTGGAAGAAAAAPEPAASMLLGLALAGAAARRRRA